MKRIFLYLIGALALSVSFFSCVPNKTYEKLKIENDSLRLEQERLQTDINNYFSAIDEISENLEQIRTIENQLSDPFDVEKSEQDQVMLITKKLQQINLLLHTNNQKIDSLNKILRNKSFKINKLESSVDNLSKANAEMMAQLEVYKRQINIGDSLLVLKDDTIQMLSAEKEWLLKDKKYTDEELAKQTDRLYTAWYVFGSTKELKSQGIIAPTGFISKSLLKGDFNRDYFIKIDTREVHQIPLYSKHAKILTTHPSDSYSLEKMDGSYVLKILNTTDFWSISRYLVIKID